MPRSFSYEMSLTESPTNAQARLREIVTEHVRQSAEMGPAQDTTGSMAFRPRWSWPLLAALTRRIRGENISLEFRPTDVGTNVTVTGKVAGDAEMVASRDFWTKTLAPA